MRPTRRGLGDELLHEAVRLVHGAETLDAGADVEALEPGGARGELRRQARDFKEKGYGGWILHARTGLVTRYLSDDWFHKIGLGVEEGRKAGLETWLSDEDRWALVDYVKSFDARFADGRELKPMPLPGAGGPNSYCSGFTRHSVNPVSGQPVGNTEDEQSVGSHVTFGRFKVLYLGDFTWNLEFDLNCPVNRIGPVDLFVASRHGQPSS